MKPYGLFILVWKILIHIGVWNYNLFVRFNRLIQVESPAIAPIITAIERQNIPSLSSVPERKGPEGKIKKEPGSYLSTQLELAPTNSCALSNVAIFRFILSRFALRTRSFLSNLSSPAEFTLEASTTLCVSESRSVSSLKDCPGCMSSLSCFNEPPGGDCDDLCCRACGSSPWQCLWCCRRLYFLAKPWLWRLQDLKGQ